MHLSLTITRHVTGTAYTTACQQACMIATRQGAAVADQAGDVKGA
ncbi:MAG: hypothetical protein SFV32_10685 [Opitutaceae bacterium]|nr:hypothetical protein [Opitutaceae bacterium]